MPAARHLPRLWLFFTGAIVVSFCVHEIGHCDVAWWGG